MASSLVKSGKNSRTAESKKSHSWWWDSHISPKNSKWLAENLEEMDQSVKRMLKLIEEDADSFAKKAEMYYQKRPELVSLVEEFYRMYRSLAERYDNVTGELRKNVPSDLQSQGSGISDAGSEPASAWVSPDQKLGRRSSGPRAAGFDVFLRSGNSGSDLVNKEGDETSTLDSESESDDSSVNNYSSASTNGDESGMRKKVVELEAELRSVREKFRVVQEENLNGSKNGDLLARLADYEEERRGAKEKIRHLEEEMIRLKNELQKYEASGFSNSTHDRVDDLQKSFQTTEVEIDGSVLEISGREVEVRTLGEELKMTKGKLLRSEKELEGKVSSNQTLLEKLGLAQKEISSLKSKSEKEKREVAKLQDRIGRYKSNLADRDQEIRTLKENVSNANKTLSEENSQLQAEITKLSKERVYLEDSLKEWDLRCQTLEEDIRRARLSIMEMESLLAEKDNSITELKTRLDELELQREELSIKTAELTAEVKSKDDQADQMNKHLHQLHMEHVELIAGAEKDRKLVQELTSRVREQEREIEKQREVISEGAEEKREAIRQLCFSLEHYRIGYHTRKP